MNEKPLNQDFFDETYAFEFFQAVRLLERMFPERAPVGRDALPISEVVRFRSRPTLAFPASQIYELREVEEEFSELTKREMYVNFMGMVSAISVLPQHYTELVVERARYRDTSFWAFVDIFSHRAISLFFRAWEKYRFPLAYERSLFEKRGSDDFTEYLFDLAGLGTRGLRDRTALPDERFLPYVGLIAQKPHSSSALQQILGDYFSVTAKVQQFFGQWLDLEEISWTRIGRANYTLGENTVVGTRVWDDQTKFRIVIGAIGFVQFQSFLPNGTAFAALNPMVRFIVGEELDFDIQLKLKAKEVPSCVLTTRAKRRPMLGWSSWLKTKPFTQDDEQVILSAKFVLSA